MKWGEPEWKIRTTPKTGTPGFMEHNYLNNVLYHNNKIIFVTGYGGDGSLNVKLSFIQQK